MKVGIYARVSDARDQSVPWQLAACRRRAEDEDWEWVEYVEDPTSAFNRRKRRDEYERLIEDVEAGTIDAPLSTDLDRLLRQDKEGARWLDLYEAGKVRHLRFTDQADINLKRAPDREDFKVRVARAVGYSERLSEKIRRTLDEKAEQGDWNGGRRSFGYRVVDDRSKPPREDGTPFKTLVPDEREAAALREAARHVVAGGSLYAVATRWNAEGPPRPGSDSPWDIRSVRRVLLNPVVAGLRVHRNGEEATFREGAWDAILDPDTFDDVARALKNRRPAETRDRGVARGWVLAGVVRCSRPDCRGPAMRGAAQQRILRDESVRVKRSYVCSAANGGCGKVGITAPDLERHVLRALMDNLGEEPPASPDAPDTSEQERELLEEIRKREQRREEIQAQLADPDNPLDIGVAAQIVRDLNGQLDGFRRELAQVVRPRGRETDLVGELRAVGEAMAFLDGKVDELPPEYVAEVNALLRARAEVRIAPARKRGIRFDPSRVAIRWRR